jgi:hypothetical protein
MNQNPIDINRILNEWRFYTYVTKARLIPRGYKLGKPSSSKKKTTIRQ